MTRQPPTPPIECPLCGRTVGSRNGHPKMHMIPAARTPWDGYDQRLWCEGGNPLQNGMLTTPIPKQETP
jgi:hypothetical protein